MSLLCIAAFSIFIRTTLRRIHVDRPRGANGAGRSGPQLGPPMAMTKFCGHGSARPSLRWELVRTVGSARLETLLRWRMPGWPKTWWCKQAMVQRAEITLAYHPHVPLMANSHWVILSTFFFTYLFKLMHLLREAFFRCKWCYSTFSTAVRKISKYSLLDWTVTRKMYAAGCSLPFYSSLL